MFSANVASLQGIRVQDGMGTFSSTWPPAEFNHLGLANLLVVA